MILNALQKNWAYEVNIAGTPLPYGSCIYSGVLNKHNPTLNICLTFFQGQIFQGLHLFMRVCLFQTLEYIWALNVMLDRGLLTNHGWT